VWKILDKEYYIGPTGEPAIDHSWNNHSVTGKHRGDDINEMQIKSAIAQRLVEESEINFV
jgi:hypothetical protein